MCVCTHGFESHSWYICSFVLVFCLRIFGSLGSFQNYCKKLLGKCLFIHTCIEYNSSNATNTGPFLSTLPTSGNALYEYTRRPTSELCSKLSLTSTQELDLPSAIVIYFIMDGNTSDLLQSFSTMMIGEPIIPTAIKQRLHLQVCIVKYNNSNTHTHTYVDIILFIL